MLSQTVEYALRAMVHLAALEPGCAVNSETIAGQTKIPHGYLSKVLRDLVVAELVRSQRGPSGGFSLAQPAEKVSLLRVVNAVDPISRIKRCPLGDPAHLKLCPLHSRLDHAIALVEQEFEQTTLAELRDTSSARGSVCRQLRPPQSAR